MKKRFFSSHSKSSALVVSLVVHAVLVVVALSFVAVTVVQKQEKKFEAKPVNRPNMRLKKLQVPVNIKKKKVRKPKLRRRIVVKPNINRSTPEIKMPEISGVKGGIGSAGSERLGGKGGIGFTMPEIEVFGIKSSGEKVFIILDASPQMMYDEMGGIAAYTIIKQELVNILGGLPPTTLFNIAVYDDGQTFTLFPEMISASASNVDKVGLWLDPLNQVHAGMGAEDWGGKTLGSGGSQNTEDLCVRKFKEQERWYRPTMLAMKQQADAIFLLTSWWGNQRIRLSDKDKKWYESSAGQRWEEHYQKGVKLLDAENKERVAQGEPPRVLRRDNRWEIITTYFPDLERPPDPGWYNHTPKDFAEAMLEIREQYKPNNLPAKSGIRKRSGTKVDFSVNVIHFREAGESRETWRHEKTEEHFKKLVSLCKGDYRMISGLDAIKSSASKSSGK
jgi:hypothetical protein